MKKNKGLPAQVGFTLIELLVVIAIIGILSSVVLASLNVARSRGANAKVKAQISSIRSTAEIYYDTNGTYNGIAGDIDGTVLDCTETDSMFQDTVSNMAAYTNVATNYPFGTTIRCTSTATEYAVSASLAGTGEYWCVDHTGTSKQVSAVDHISAHPDNDTTCN